MKRSTTFAFLVFFFVNSLIINAQSLNYSWANSIDGSEIVRIASVTVDPSGSIYTTGEFSQTADFDPGPGVFNLSTSFSRTALFIQKLDQNGNFMWAKKIDGEDTESGRSITIDSSGNVLVTGLFIDTVDFDPDPTNTFNLNGQGASVFVLKLDPQGNFIWAKAFISDDYFPTAGYDIKAGKNGDVYLTGEFRNQVDFDPGPGIFNLGTPATGTSNIFIVRLDHNGNFIWAGEIGSTSFEDKGNTLYLDNDENVYFSGNFSGSNIDFDIGPNTFNLTSNGGQDNFICKMDSSGNFIWAKQFGSNSTDIANDMVIDYVSDHIYVTGSFYATTDFDPSASTFSLTPGGQYDSYISKYDLNGNFIWAKSFESSDPNHYNSGNSINIDTARNVIVTGRFQGTIDTDPGSSSVNISTLTNYRDIFLTSLDDAGNFIWSEHINGTSSQSGFGNLPRDLVIDENNNLFSCGEFTGSANFSPSSSPAFTLNSTTGGSPSGYLFKWSPCASLPGAPIQESSCDSYTSPSGKVFTSSANFLDTLQGASGCDSIISINLLIKYSTSNTLTVNACDSFVSPVGNIYKQGGIYNEVIPNNAGCDSNITINLSIISAGQSSINPVVCDSYTSPSGKVFTSSGNFLDTLQNASGCDSIIDINLTINKSSNSNLTITACDSFISPSGNIIRQGGIYNETIPNQVGCDSNITIDLTILPVNRPIINPVSCGPYLSPSGKFTFTSSGTYFDTLSSQQDCDIIFQINLVVNQPSYNTLSPIRCDSFVSPSGKYSYFQSGLYYDTIYASPPTCNSYYTINFQKTAIDNRVFNFGDSLLAFANPDNHSFQWLDCDDSYAMIPGENSAGYRPDTTGNFAVEIEQNNCIDTSECELVNFIGLGENHSSPTSFVIYPNPSSEYFFLESSLYHSISNKKLQIFNINGAEVYQNMLSSSLTKVDVSSLPEGIYLIKYNNQYEKLIISR